VHIPVQLAGAVVSRHTARPDVQCVLPHRIVICAVCTDVRRFIVLLCDAWVLLSLPHPGPAHLLPALSFSLANVDDIEHYGVYHALWHFLSMPSIYFVIEARDGVPFYIHVIQYWISIRDFFPSLWRCPPERIDAATSGASEPPESKHVRSLHHQDGGDGNGNGNQIPEALLYFPFLDSTTSKKSSKKRRKKKKDSMDRAQTHHHHQVSNNEDENDDDRLMTVAVDGVHSTTNGIDGNIAAVSSLVQAPSNQQALLCHRHVPAHFFNVSNPDGGMGSDVPPQRGDCKSIFLPPPKKIRTHTMPLDDGGVGYQNGGAGQWDLYREEEARRVNYYKEMQGQQYGGGGAEEGFSILSSPDRRATMFINSPL